MRLGRSDQDRGWDLGGAHLVEDPVDLGLELGGGGLRREEAVVHGPAGGGHVANTHFPMGISPPGDDAAQHLATPSSTTIYFRVDEIEPYAERVGALGGRVLARHDYDSGANAECVDDQGYRFDLWKPAPGY